MYLVKLSVFKAYISRFFLFIAANYLALIAYFWN